MADETDSTVLGTFSIPIRFVLDGVPKVVTGIRSLRGNLEQVARVTILWDRFLFSLTRGYQFLTRTLGASKFATIALEAQNTAYHLGITTQEFQELSHVARKFGADVNDVSDLLGTLADRSVDVIAGTGYVEDFKLFGLAAEDLKDKLPIELLYVFSDAVASIEDPTKRLAAVVRVLGDDVGRKFGPAIARGSEELRTYMKLVDDLNATMGPEELRRAEKYAIATSNMGLAMEAVQMRVAGALIPSLTLFSEALTAMSVHAMPYFDWMTTKIRLNMTSWATELRNDLEWALASLTEVTGSATESLLRFTRAMGIAGLFAFALGLGTVAGKAVLATAAFLLLSVAIEDVLGYTEGDDSLTGRFVEWEEATLGLGVHIRALAEDFNALAEAMGAGPDAASKAFDTMHTVVVAALRGISAIFADVILTPFRQLGIILDSAITSFRLLLSYMTRFAQIYRNDLSGRLDEAEGNRGSVLGVAQGVTAPFAAVDSSIRRFFTDPGFLSAGGDIVQGYVDRLQRRESARPISAAAESFGGALQENSAFYRRLNPSRGIQQLPGDNFGRQTSNNTTVNINVSGAANPGQAAADIAGVTTRQAVN